MHKSFVRRLEAIEIALPDDEADDLPSIRQVIDLAFPHLHRTPEFAELSRKALSVGLTLEEEKRFLDVYAVGLAAAFGEDVARRMLAAVTPDDGKRYVPVCTVLGEQYCDKANKSANT